MALPHPRITLARHPHSGRVMWFLQARNGTTTAKGADTWTQRGVALRNAASTLGIDAYEACALRDTTGMHLDYSRGPIRC